MKAVVMAGGEGSRLRPLTCNKPKPMVPILNVPVMEHILLLLKKHGITDIAITLQYLPKVIEEYFGDGKDFGLNLIYSVEDSPLGTAGSVKQIEDFLDDTFIVISGDALTDFNLGKISNFHREKDATATITLTQVSNPTEFGIVMCDSENKITRFLEKPSWSEVFSNTINTGIYVLEPQILKLMEPFRKYDFSRDIFPALLEAKEKLYGFPSEGYWCDIGSPEQYMQANFDALTGKVKLEKINLSSSTEILLGADSYVSSDAKISGPIYIGSNCKIRRGAVLEGPVVIGDNCVIDMGSSIKNSVLWNNTYVGEESKLRGAQISSNCIIKESSSIYEGSFIGESCSIEADCLINPRVKVWPGKIVEKGTVLKRNLIWGGQGSISIFNSQGISGLINLDIKPETAVHLGSAFGTIFSKGDTIVVSSDYQDTAKMLKKALISGLSSTGVKVVDLSVSPIPFNPFSIRRFGAKGGIHVVIDSKLKVAEFKLFDSNGIYISPTVIKKLEQVYKMEEFRRVFADEVGTIIKPLDSTGSYIIHYLRNLESKVISEKKFKIAFSCIEKEAVIGNILRALGCITFPSTSQELRENVVKNNCILGIDLEDNYEHFVLYDEKGNPLSNETNLNLFSLIALELEEKKCIALPVNISKGLENMCHEKAGTLLTTKANSHALMEACLKGPTAFGSDSKNGFIFSQFLPSFDALMALGKLLEYLALTNLSLTSLINKLPAANMFRTSIPCTLQAKGLFMRRFMEELEAHTVELFDGIKIIKDKTWLLVLPDPTKPLLHLYGEAEDEKDESFIKRHLFLVNKILQETTAG